MKLVVRPLQAAEVQAVARVVRSSYEARLSSYLTYAQEGLPALLMDGIDFPWLDDSKRRDVALLGDEVVGFAEWQVERGRHFLSHVCVSPPHQSTGVASALLRHHLAGVTGEQQVELDVFQHNYTAVRLYTRLGLRDTEEHVSWYRRTVDSSERTVVPAWTPGSQALSSMAMYRRYGFCYLAGQLRGRTVQVGLIGAQTVRVMNRADFEDVGLLAAVKSFRPCVHDVLLIESDPGVTERTGERLLTSVRMRGRVVDITRNLA